MVKHSAAAFGDVGALTPPPAIELTGNIKKKTNTPDRRFAGHKPCLATRPNELYAPGYMWRHGADKSAVPGIGWRLFHRTGRKQMWRLHVDFKKTRDQGKAATVDASREAAHTAAVLERYHSTKQSTPGNAAVRYACNAAHVAQTLPQAEL